MTQDNKETKSDREETPYMEVSRGCLQQIQLLKLTSLRIVSAIQYAMNCSCVGQLLPLVLS
jgi:hypothetical protein